MPAVFALPDIDSWWASGKSEPLVCALVLANARKAASSVLLLPPNQVFVKRVTSRAIAGTGDQGEHLAHFDVISDRRRNAANSDES